MKTNCTQLMEKALVPSPYCLGSQMMGHATKKCWTLHPKLKPIIAREKTTSKGGQGQATTKNPLGEDKTWKSKVVELEAKMAAISVTTEGGGASPKETKKITPSCCAEKNNHMLCGMAMGREGPSLKAYTQIGSQTINVLDVPHGVSLALDLLRGEEHRQVRLHESFTLEDMVPTSSMVPPIWPQVCDVKIPLEYQDRRNNGSGDTSGIMFNVATTVCGLAIGIGAG